MLAHFVRSMYRTMEDFYLYIPVLGGKKISGADVRDQNGEY